VVLASTVRIARGLDGLQRDYGIGVQILRDLGVRAFHSLLSNNPRKLVAIEGYGLSVTQWLPPPKSPRPLRHSVI
jgi:3,4-dihydroxy 2-butanone 4-phosphate synthase / GTP cyclohydrolase II